MNDINTKIQEIIDKDAIRELVNIYCRAADRHDNDLMRSLYHEDAFDDHGSFFKGKAMEFIDGHQKWLIFIPFWNWDK